MINRRNALALAISLAFGLAAPAAHAEENPLAIVTLFYKVSAGKDGKYSGASAYYQDHIRAKYFSKSLRAMADALERKAKKENDVGLDFDPVTNSQDPSVGDLKIEADGDAAVNASFVGVGAGERMIVRYIFVREGNFWKLDNMTAGRGEDAWDLRNLIKSLLAGKAN